MLDNEAFEGQAALPGFVGSRDRSVPVQVAELTAPNVTVLERCLVHAGQPIRSPELAVAAVRST